MAFDFSMNYRVRAFGNAFVYFWPRWTFPQGQTSYQNMAKDFVTRKEDYSKWYNDLVLKADMAENSAVRGCMVIKPYGYSV